VDFSEARDLFVNIFQILRPNYKFFDCGLILEKQRGLNAKYPKLEFPGIFFLKEIRGSSPRARGPRAAPVHGGRQSPSQEGSPEIGQNGVPVRGTSPRLRKNGEGTEVSLTDGKRGRRRVGHNRATMGNNLRRRCSMEWELRTRKHAIEGEVSVVMAGGCSSSFYSGRGGGGHTGAGEGETADSNGLNTIDDGEA
jgi:hypothetical protein